MSVWGLGAPRSGTVTLAYMLNGIHEPKPLIAVEAGAYWRGNVQEALFKKLRGRVEMGMPIVDPAHSFVVPAIVAVDRDAEFIVMVREPIACIRSLVARGTYVIDTAGNRARPAAKPWPEGCTPLDKCVWYWKETYRTILRDMPPGDCRVQRTEELPPGIVLNADNRVGRFKLSDEQLEAIDRETAELYDKVLSMGPPL